MNRKGKHNDSTLAQVAERRAQAFLLRVCGLELKQIAKILEYSDHTTVVYFLQTHESELQTNVVYQSVFAELQKYSRVENLT
jgi:hypothetical protein